MAEYIKRESIQKALKNVTDDPSCPLFLAAMIEQYIDQEPTADVTPVKHGKWIEYPRAHYFKCSECKETVPYKKAVLIRGKRKYKYCPNCGAKMGAEG